MGTQDKFRWAEALDWLKERILDSTLERDELWIFIRGIADNDDVQAYFEASMDAEGFFEPLEEEA